MKLIDIHSHVLPKMDDGSDSINTSCEMLKSLVRQGVGRICATSHYYAEKEKVEQFAERRAEAIRTLFQAEDTPEIELIPGAETAYFRGISELQQIEKLCYAGTRTLLLEMPFAIWTEYQIEEVISLVLDRNYQVILAHPERFMFSKQNEQYLKKLMQLPIYLQINAESINRLTTRRTALRFIEMAERPLLGSDCHDMDRRAPKFEKARQIIRLKMGTECLEYMDACAECVLDGASEVKRNV